jgi:hypothetical protein
MLRKKGRELRNFYTKKHTASSSHSLHKKKRGENQQFSFSAALPAVIRPVGPAPTMTRSYVLAIVLLQAKSVHPLLLQ